MLCSFSLKYSSSRYRWLTSPLHIEAAVGGLGVGGVGWVEKAWEQENACLINYIRLLHVLPEMFAL